MRDGAADPMQHELVESLLDAGFLVKYEAITGTKKDNKEVDVLAYKDGDLFILECKNVYHPVNAYELRSTYDHLKKSRRST
jgi:Holliday junction resolvase